MVKKGKMKQLLNFLDGFDLGEWEVEEIISSVLNAGFVICPTCGATFGNVVWDDTVGTEGINDGDVRCLMCGEKAYMDFTGTPVEGQHPLQMLKEYVYSIR
jgi:hypothetical protein